MIIIDLTFLIVFVGLVYPIITSVLFIVLGNILNGLFLSFEKFSLLICVIQGMFVSFLFLANSVSNWIGLKWFKTGSRGIAIGLLAGLFVIPVLGKIL